MQAVSQIALACLGSLGFSVLLHIRGKKMFLGVCGAGVAWLMFLGCRGAGFSLFSAMFCATCAVALASELLARIAKTPVLLLLMPMLIPLIPGGDLYYMMRTIVQDNKDQTAAALRLVLEQAGAIALGVIVGASVASALHAVRTYYKNAEGKICKP